MPVRSAIFIALGFLLALAFSTPASAALRISGDLTALERNNGAWTTSLTISDDTAAPYDRCAFWRTEDGTATSVYGSEAAPDYVWEGGYLCLEPGITSKAIDVTISGDTEFEQDESFKVRIFMAYGPVGTGQNIPYPIADDSADITLLNDDAKPPTGKPKGKPKRAECTTAYMKKRYAHHPYFNGGSQFFGLMRLAAKGLRAGGITKLVEGRAKLNNVLACPKGFVVGRVEMLRKGAPPLLVAKGRLKLNFKGVGRVAVRLRPTAKGRAALRRRSRVRTRVTVRHVDTQKKAAQRRFRVTLTR